MFITQGAYLLFSDFGHMIALNVRVLILKRESSLLYQVKNIFTNLNACFSSNFGLIPFLSIYLISSTVDIESKFNLETIFL